LRIIAEYAELQVFGNFSFLQGASSYEELSTTAAAFGYHALGLTDRNTLAGLVQAHIACKKNDLRFIPGCRIDLLKTPSWCWDSVDYDLSSLPRELRKQVGKNNDGNLDGYSLLVYPTDRAAYGRLCQMLTLGKRRAPKAQCFLTLDDLAPYSNGLIAVAIVPESVFLDQDDESEFYNYLNPLKEIFKTGIYISGQALCHGDDARRLWQTHVLANRCQIPMVATNDVRMHTPERRALLDTLTCIRAHCTIDEAGHLIQLNGERHLKPIWEMARLFKDYPDALKCTIEIADACRFDLDELRYEYPAEPVPPNTTPQAELERLTWLGAQKRYPQGLPAKVLQQIDYEFRIIEKLGYAPYFLTVYDIVKFAENQNIICQGRGSAANSSVCYCLGITAVNPLDTPLLFERFVSTARNEPPDIDVDFEHERREEVIQYVYDKYGRDRAGMTATTITYRTRSAMRDVGKALGLSEDSISNLLSTVWGSSSSRISDVQVREAGLDPSNTRIALTLDLVDQLKGFPRHQSQHVGGFVITKTALSKVVPIANAAMEERTVIEWDKDDINALGILKVDILGLGILTCIHKAFDLVSKHYGKQLHLASLPANDEATYNMLSRADTIGVFQVESRAQMNMLPRLKPRCLYDLVIEIAIVRPGPIQGDMVHPYLRRRNDKEKFEYASPKLEKVLKRTLGIPLFQEQAMNIAIIGANFTPSEADALRRAMASWRRNGSVKNFRQKFMSGMKANRYSDNFAQQCFKQIEGFGEYGFPESHAFSFALLVYASAWLKSHYPAAFACALLNSQPMGFYAPTQIIQDAQRHGVEVRPVDINFSDWDNILEPHPNNCGKEMKVALRLGFRQINGINEYQAKCIVTARGQIAYRNPYDVWQRVSLLGLNTKETLEKMAKADAFACISSSPELRSKGQETTKNGFSRRDALWAVKGLNQAPLPLFVFAEAESIQPSPAGRQGTGDSVFEPVVEMPRLKPGEEVVEDYSALRLSLRKHPVALLRSDLTRICSVQASRLSEIESGKNIAVAGLVICRQRPSTANGTIFMTLEDETGVSNLIIRPNVFQTFRKEIHLASLLYAEGRVQKHGLVINILVKHLVDLTKMLHKLSTTDAQMKPVPAHADRLRHNKRTGDNTDNCEIQNFWSREMR